MRWIRDSPGWPAVRSLLSERPYRPGVPEIRHWDDLEDAYLRMPDDAWDALRSVPGMTGDDDFDAAMLEFRLSVDRRPAEELGDATFEDE